MGIDEAIEKILQEVTLISNETVGSYCTEITHTVSLDNFKYYLQLVGGIGFIEGRKQQGHGKLVIQKQYNLNIKIWESASDIARHYHVDKSTVIKAINNKSKFKGFVWEYLK